MSEYTIDNNIASLAGEIASELKFSHEIYSESFYNFFLRIPRLSSSYDTILITVSDRLLDIHTLTRKTNFGRRSVPILQQYESLRKQAVDGLVCQIEFINDITKSKTPIKFIYADLYVKSRYIERRPSDEKLPICCWPLTGRITNPITYRVSHGGETPGIHED